MSLKNTLTWLFFAFSLYSFGGGFVEGFQYSSWRLISQQDFPAVHHVISQQILRFYVPFLFLSVPVSILLIWFHHSAMSRGLIIVAALIQTYIVVSTIALAVPLQNSLNQAWSQAAIDKLIWYHTWLRMAPGFVHLLLVLALLWQVVSARTQIN